MNAAASAVDKPDLGDLLDLQLSRVKSQFLKNNTKNRQRVNSIVSELRLNMRKQKHFRAAWAPFEGSCQSLDVVLHPLKLPSPRSPSSAPRPNLCPSLVGGARGDVLFIFQTQPFIQCCDETPSGLRLAFSLSRCWLKSKRLQIWASY